MQEIFLIVDILISIGAILSGYYMKFRAPGDEKMQYGIRTAHSKKSYDTWSYANTVCGGAWLKIGFCGSMAVIAAMLLSGQLNDAAAVLLSVGILAVIVIALSCSATAVIMGLVSRFDDDGRPINKE